MPELPEVETTRAGLEPLIGGQHVKEVVIRDGRLRWPVDPAIATHMAGQPIVTVRRRAKYLLWDTPVGTCMVHLGMSGSLRVVDAKAELLAHDHIIWRLGNGREVRLRDPRRFGSVHWIAGAVDEHALVRNLGPEPLGNQFDAGWLFERSRHKRVAVKNFIMDAKQVVGVGNIYASEALFRARILPTRAAGRVSLPRYEVLTHEIRAVLSEAIAAGGTTLRDFIRNEGEPGYFAQELSVYGREGEPCRNCGSALKRKVIGQRSSFYCSRCQR